MRKIAARIWIGNAHEARNLHLIQSTGIEAVVDLAIEEPPARTSRDMIYSRVPISDGSGNSAVRIRFAVDTICGLVSADVPILVACSAGMSRSPVLVAAAIFQLRGCSFEEALSQVVASGSADVSAAFLKDVVEALK